MSAVVSSQSLAAADVQCVCVQMRVENITLGIRQCLSISFAQQKIDLIVLFTVSFLGLIQDKHCKMSLVRLTAASALLLM